MSSYKNHNYWPSFVDLSLSFIIILALILAVSIYNSAQDKVKYQRIIGTQDEVLKEADSLYKFSQEVTDTNFLKIGLDSSKTKLIAGFTNQAEILFNSGSIAYQNNSNAKLSVEKLNALFDSLLTKRKNIVGKIMIEGHTDKRRISEGLRSEFRSNWELSAARAGKIVREILGDENEKELGKYFKYFMAIGYANTDPTGYGDDQDRRISVTITTAAAEKLSQNINELK